MFTNPEKITESSDTFTDKELVKAPETFPVAQEESKPQMSPAYTSALLSITSTPLFTDEQCKSIVDMCIDEIWSSVKVTGSFKLQSASTQRIRGALTDFPFTSLKDAIVTANNQFYNLDLLGIIDNDYPQIVRYNKGDFYKMHAEINPIMTTSKLSFLITLSAPEDYVGGEIEFLNTELDYETINKPGTMIVFPSFLPFSIKPIKKGKKFFATGSIHGNSFR